MRKIAGYLMFVPLIFSVVHAGEADYADQVFARLNYISGDTYVQRATDLGYEAGIINMPLTQGDRVSTSDGRAEIYLGIGSFLRLDRWTNLDIVDLPRLRSGMTRVRLWDGNMYLSIRRLEKEKPVEIHTSDASIYILDRGLYRIDVRENRETEIFVFRGMAETAGDGRSILLKSGQRMEVVQGHFTSYPAPFTVAAVDSFDRWSGYRDELLQRRLARYYLPGELEDFEYELAAYGRWDYVSPYGYVWVPGGMSVGWQPYRHGRWAWYPSCGWTWIPYESWGWVTSHYGRWHWRLDLGWYWIPTTRWGPGWVSWYVGVDYCGWAPLTYYGRPAVIINNHFYADYSETYYPAASAAMTVVAKNQLSARDVSRVAVSKKSLTSKTTRIRMSSSAPAPAGSAKQMKVHAQDKEKLLLSKPGRSSETSSRSRIKSGSAERGTSRSPEAKATMRVTPRTPEAGKTMPPSSREASAGGSDRRIKTEPAQARTTETAVPAKKSSTSRIKRDAARESSPSKSSSRSSSAKSSSAKKSSSTSSRSSSESVSATSKSRSSSKKSSSSRPSGSSAKSGSSSRKSSAAKSAGSASKPRSSSSKKSSASGKSSRSKSSGSKKKKKR